MTAGRIMIVEDNTAVAEDCRDCLESYGYRVTSIVASGEESIEKAGTEHPDAVLMDIRLRDEMDGVEAAGKIYSRFDIPVVFLSAHGDRELFRRARQVGSYGYLVKPFEERELFATLEMAIYKANSDREQKQRQQRLWQTQEMNIVGTLAGGVAHQFNNALAVIAGNVDLISMDFPENKKITNYTQEIKKPVHRMAQITTQLLAYARGGKYNVTKIQLNHFVENTIQLFQHTIKPEILIRKELSHDVLNVKADINQMQMVLSAVLSNASEAIDGDGCIQIRSENTIITGTARFKSHGLVPGSYVKLSITDNGKGMDEQTKERAFDPFFTTKFKGRGLGLAAVYGIIKSHKGMVTIDSKPGNGTTIEIYLPAIQPHAEKLTNEQIKPISSLCNVLVIEDDDMVLAVCSAMLKKMGYRAIEAKTGKEAIDIINKAEVNIDIAILDIILPDINGLALYPLLKKILPDLKVLVCSGYSINGTAKEILKLGAQDFLQKPFTMAELSNKLKTIQEKLFL